VWQGQSARKLEKDIRPVPFNNAAHSLQARDVAKQNNAKGKKITSRFHSTKQAN
jgi:hypothetical protein